MKQQFFYDFKNLDKIILFVLLLLVLLGWFNIYAVGFKGEDQYLLDLSKNHGKQFIWILIALLIGFTALLLDVKLLMTFANPIYAISLIVLVAVLFFGTEINSSKSWFQIGGFNIQPSELVKFSTAIAIGRFISNNKHKPLTFKIRIVPYIMLFIPFALIILQNDMGTALVFSAFILVLYREGYVSGTAMILFASAIFLFVLTLIFNEYYIIGGLAVVTIITVIILKNRKKEIVMFIILFFISSIYVYSVDYAFDNFLQKHQKNRIEVLIDSSIDPQGVGYNLTQSKIAIGSGGLWGKGYLKGTQTKFDFVPEQTTDFIFCTIGEEWGFAGSIVVISLYIILLIRLIILAERQRSVFSRIFGYSVASLLFFHFLVNIGMTLGIMPVIGIPLPFFSYGGSSLIAFTLMIFIFLKLDARRLDLL